MAHGKRLLRLGNPNSPKHSWSESQACWCDARWRCTSKQLHIKQLTPLGLIRCRNIVWGISSILNDPEDAFPTISLKNSGICGPFFKKVMLFLFHTNDPNMHWVTKSYANSIYKFGENTSALVTVPSWKTDGASFFSKKLCDEWQLLFGFFERKMSRIQRTNYTYIYACRNIRMIANLTQNMKNMTYDICTYPYTCTYTYTYVYIYIYIYIYMYIRVYMYSYIKPYFKIHLYQLQ